MNFGFISGLTKNLGILTGNKETPVDGKFSDMSKEDLITTATILQDGYDKLKVDYSNLQKENKLLKNSVINNSNEQSSEFGKFFSNFKNAILDDGISPEKNLNDFKSFLYNECLLYGGIEEDDVNVLEQINIIDDSDWENNKNIYLFKQKVLERNYREMFNNLLISHEINTFLQKEKPHTITTNKIQEEASSKSNNTLMNMITNDIKESPIKKSNTVNNPQSENKIEQVFDYKTKNFSEAKSPIAKVPSSEKKPILLSNKNKKKEAFSLLENLLKDDEEEEDDTTFKDLKTSKWNEDDN